MFGIGPTGLSKAAGRPSLSLPRTDQRSGIAAHEVRLPTEHSEIDYLAVCIERPGKCGGPRIATRVRSDTNDDQTLFAVSLRWVCGRREDVQAEHPGQVRGHKLATDAVAREIQPR